MENSEIHILKLKNIASYAMTAVQFALNAKNGEAEKWRIDCNPFFVHKQRTIR